MQMISKAKTSHLPCQAAASSQESTQTDCPEIRGAAETLHVGMGESSSTLGKSVSPTAVASTEPGGVMMPQSHESDGSSSHPDHAISWFLNVHCELSLTREMFLSPNLNQLIGPIHDFHFPRFLIIVSGNS